MHFDVLFFGPAGITLNYPGTGGTEADGLARRTHDWIGWMRDEDAGRLAAHAPLEILRDIVSRLPGRESKTVAQLERSSLALADLARLPGRVDVVLADGTLWRDDLVQLDALLDQALGCLTEGGLLAAAFPAAPRGSAAREVRLRIPGATAAPALGLHEVELQYRLHRAGFGGVRVLRLAAPAGAESDCLLCLAVRRANN